MYFIYLLLGFVAICFAIWLIFLIKRGPKAIFLSSLLGVLLLFVLKFFESNFGVLIPINFITLGFSTILGIPGVIGIMTIIFLFF